MVKHQVSDIESRLENVDWVEDTHNSDFTKCFDMHVEINNIVDNLKPKITQACMSAPRSNT